MPRIPKLTKQTAYNLHKRLCVELGIQPVPYRNFKIKQYHYEDAAYGAYYFDECIIELYKRSFKTTQNEDRDWRKTVAHETYHHYQAARGWLHRRELNCNKLSFTIAYWKGRPCYSFERLSSFKRPWEAGARRYERKIAVREGWARSS